MTLSLPQNIDSTANPTFQSITLSSTGTQINMNSAGHQTSIAAVLSSTDQQMTISDVTAYTTTAAFLVCTTGSCIVTNSPTVGAVLTGTGTSTATFQDCL